MELNDFLQFYAVSCRERPEVVWKNLKYYHYTNDLKLYSEIDIEIIDPTELPRYLLMKNSELYTNLFKIINYSEEVESNVWSLL